MAIGQHLETYLNEYTPLDEKVNGRIYPMRFPRGTGFPCVTYHRITSPSQPDLPVSYPTYQLSVWAERYGEATEVAELIKQALHRHKGQLGDIKILNATHQDTREDYNEGSELYHFPVDIKFIHREV